MVDGRHMDSRFRGNDIFEFQREMNHMTTACPAKRSVRRIRRAPARKAPAATSTASPYREKPDLSESIAKYESTRSAQEFIADPGGKRTRWPVLIAASVLIVFAAGFLTSRILF